MSNSQIKIRDLRRCLSQAEGAEKGKNLRNWLQRVAEQTVLDKVAQPRRVGQEYKILSTNVSGKFKDGR